MPHVEKCIYRSEPDPSEPPLKKLRPNDYVPWTGNDATGRKEHFMTPSHDIGFSSIPGKCTFEQKYCQNSNISSEDSHTAIKRYDSDSRIGSHHLTDRTEGISRHTSGCASSEDDYRVNSVSASGSEFSLTSREFIGPLFPRRTVNVARSSCSEDRQHAGSTSPCYKISTIELGKGTSRSKVNDGMDYELRQFYMELHQLEEDTENIQVKTNEQQVSNAIQGPPNPPKSIFVCSPEEYSVAPHNNPVSIKKWEHHVSNRANKPLLNTAPPPRFHGPSPQPLTKSHGHQLQDGTLRESECKASNAVFEPFCTQRPLNCVFPNPQSSFNAETVWRRQNPSDRANNPHFMNTVPPRFHGPPPGVYNFQLNFPSQDIKPYIMYPENQNLYGCTEEYPRPNDCHQWNGMPPHQVKYGDHGDSFGKPIYDDKRVSQHIDQNGENAYRPQETPLSQTPRTFNEQHLDVNTHSSDKPCRRCKRTLILLRGVPGSGKSTLARVLLDLCSDGLVFSTDDYFCQKEGYVYDVTRLGDAHHWNQNRAKRAMDDERSPIIIDNTNIQGWEMKPYVQMAIERDYAVEFLEPDTWWKLDPLELEKRNKHGVPRDTISKMLDRYEQDMTVLHVMNSVEPPHLSSSRRAAPPRQRCEASVNTLQQRPTFHNR